MVYTKEELKIKYLKTKDKRKEYYLKNKDKIKEYYINNKEKIKNRKKEYRKNNSQYLKDKAKEYFIRNSKRLITKRRLFKYKLSIEKYNEMVLFQNNLCLICKKPETTKNKFGTIFPLSIDHCHKTNKIRGLLCMQCNTTLGRFKHDIELLKQAIKYLENS